MGYILKVNDFAEGEKKNHQLKFGNLIIITKLVGYWEGDGWRVVGRKMKDQDLEVQYRALTQLVMHEKFLNLFMPSVTLVVHSST